MATPLDALLNTLYESGNPETPESAAERAAWNEDNAKRPRRRRRPPLPGFAEGSERWHDALLAQVPLVEYDLAAATPQPGLFDPQLTPRYGIDEAHLYASPYAYAGPPPDGAGDFDELIDHHTPIAWDQTRVMCACPRAMCLIDRKRWNQGYRFCPGCCPPRRFRTRLQNRQPSNGAHGRSAVAARPPLRTLRKHGGIHART